MKHDALAVDRMLLDAAEDPWRADELRAITRRLGIDGDVSAPRTLWFNITDGMRLRALDWVVTVRRCCCCTEGRSRPKPGTMFAWACVPNSG